MNPGWKKTNWSGTTEKRTRTEEQRRAQRLSLHTPAHPRFIPEGQPSDLRRSPTATPIGCLTTPFFSRCSYPLICFASSNANPLRRCRSFRSKFRERWNERCPSENLVSKVLFEKINPKKFVDLREITC